VTDDSPIRPNGLNLYIEIEAEEPTEDRAHLSGAKGVHHLAAGSVASNKSLEGQLIDADSRASSTASSSLL